MRTVYLGHNPIKEIHISFLSGDPPSVNSQTKFIDSERNLLDSRDVRIVKIPSNAEHTQRLKRIAPNSRKSMCDNMKEEVETTMLLRTITVPNVERKVSKILCQPKFDKDKNRWVITKQQLANYIIKSVPSLPLDEIAWYIREYQIDPIRIITTFPKLGSYKLT